MFVFFIFHSTSIYTLQGQRQLSTYCLPNKIVPGTQEMFTKYLQNDMIVQLLHSDLFIQFLMATFSNRIKGLSSSLRKNMFQTHPTQPQMCLKVLISRDHGMEMVVFFKCKRQKIGDLLRSCSLTAIVKADQSAMAALHEASGFHHRILISATKEMTQRHRMPQIEDPGDHLVQLPPTAIQQQNLNSKHLCPNQGLFPLSYTASSYAHVYLYMHKQGL